MKFLGNARANAIYEFHHPPGYEKPTCLDSARYY